MANQRDWLEIRQERSRFWYLRLPFPKDLVALELAATGKALKTKYISTGKERYDEARIWALPKIQAHLETIEIDRLAYTNRLNRGGDFASGLKADLAPGETRWLDDGGRIVASKDGSFAVRYDAEGDVIGKEDIKLIPWSTFNGKAPAHVEINRKREEVEVAAAPDLNDKIFDHWKIGQKVDRINDAKRTMALLSKVAPKRCFATLEVKDVRAFILRMESEGQSTGSITKKVGALNAMINKALGHEDFPALKANPFRIKNLIPQGIAGRRAAPTLFSDDELIAIHADLPRWPAEPRLLFSMLYFMGGRLSEPFQTVGEETIEGVRCIQYGSKTVYCEDRFVPVPPEVLALLPARVDGPLFEHQEDYVTRRMMARIHALGIPELSGKTAQSLRHRFVTIGARRGVDKNIIDTLTGHVSDDLKQNAGDANRTARNKSAIYWRYMRGFGPHPLLDAMAVLAPVVTPR